MMTQTPWLTPLPAGDITNYTRASFTHACRGHEKMGAVLSYFVSRALEVRTSELQTSVTLQCVHKDILAQISISESSLGTYIKQLITWGYLSGNGYQRTYKIDLSSIAQVLACPPKPLPIKPRGKYARQGTFIKPSARPTILDEDARIVQLQIRRAELLTELRKIEDELAQFTFVIYGCIDPRDKVVFYVGIALDGERRFKQHLSCVEDNEAKNARIQELRDLGLTPLFVQFEVIQGKAHALAREQYWIEHFKGQGIQLVNAEGGQS